MVNNSKILTVSYGTFSCTLEGFDDSFDTMKAIAEYFRDLAADDRYFGAEPAAPDAEMLARIAEREISRRVQAHDTNGKIHLRADAAALPSAGSVADDTTADHTAADATAEWVAPTPATAERTEQPFPTSPSAPAMRSANSSSESMADKLRRIRAVAAPSVSTFPASGFDEDDNTQDFLATAAIPPQDIQSGTAQPDDVAADESPSDAARDGGAPDMSPEPQPEITAKINEEFTAGPATTIAEPASESAAETVQDDAEVMETAEENDDALPEITDDVDADEDILTRLNAEADASPELAADMSEEDATEDEQPDDLDAFLRDTSLDAPTSVDAEEYDDEADDEYGAGDDTLSQLLADALDGGSADGDDAQAEVEPESSAEADETLEVDVAEDDDEAAAGPASERPLDARVIKMKRSDLDAALASENLQEVIEAEDASSDLSDEAEADLQRELAEVEAELHQTRAPETIINDATMSSASVDASEDAAETVDIPHDAAADVASEGADEESEADHEGDAPRAKHLDARASDAQAARIFDEADTQLEEPESNQRRSAIQHLRAAVAATKAERRAGGAMQADVDDQPYRNDLQSAVRPRRPQPVATSMTPRPGAIAASRPAPLKLVAEQRIDSPADAVQPVRPRRITRADLVPARPEPSARLDGTNAASGAENAQGSAGFADFAEQKGASSLTEMLEAAAAYLADVEGTPQFSRPMLMQKLREAQDEEFSREDGLRSFGQLLREGKLQKLKGGRFAVTSVTEFRQSA